VHWSCRLCSMCRKTPMKFAQLGGSLVRSPWNPTLNLAKTILLQFREDNTRVAIAHLYQLMVYKDLVSMCRKPPMKFASFLKFWLTGSLVNDYECILLFHDFRMNYYYVPLLLFVMMWCTSWLHALWLKMDFQVIHLIRFYNTKFTYSWNSKFKAILILWLLKLILDVLNGTYKYPCNVFMSLPLLAHCPKVNIRNCGVQGWKIALTTTAQDKSDLRLNLSQS